MKKYKFILLLSLVALFILGCETDDKFSGSPVGNMKIETLMGSISTPSNAALTGQEIDFTASLPVGVTFSDTVTVEVTSLRSDGGRIRDYFDIMPNQTSVTDKIEAVGGIVFSTTFELSITAINLQTTVPGKHYLMTSNKVILSTGDTSIPSVEDDRLKVSFTWYNATTTNKMKMTVQKPGSSTDVNVGYLSGSNSSIRQHSIRTTGTSSNNGSISHAEGEYIFKIGGEGPGTLLTEPFDMDYRMIVVYPDDKVEVYDGTYLGLTGTSATVPLLKVTKEVIDGEVVFTSTRL